MIPTILKKYFELSEKTFTLKNLQKKGPKIREFSITATFTAHLDYKDEESTHFLTSHKIIIKFWNISSRKSALSKRIKKLTVLQLITYLESMLNY